VRGATVVETGLTDHSKSRVAPDDFDTTHEIVTVSRVLDRHEVGDFSDASSERKRVSRIFVSLR
jgi:hypothetical protein